MMDHAHNKDGALHYGGPGHVKLVANSTVEIGQRDGTQNAPFQNIVVERKKELFENNSDVDQCDISRKTKS
jgi:hypothetical protein